MAVSRTADLQASRSAASAGAGPGGGGRKHSETQHGVRQSWRHQPPCCRGRAWEFRGHTEHSSEVPACSIRELDPESILKVSCGSFNYKEGGILSHSPSLCSGYNCSSPSGAWWCPRVIPVLKLWVFKRDGPIWFSLNYMKTSKNIICVYRSMKIQRSHL